MIFEHCGIVFCNVIRAIDGRAAFSIFCCAARDSSRVDMRKFFSGASQRCWAAVAVVALARCFSIWFFGDFYSDLFQSMCESAM